MISLPNAISSELQKGHGSEVTSMASGLGSVSFVFKRSNWVDESCKVSAMPH
jgi:hypothetical protein